MVDFDFSLFIAFSLKGEFTMCEKRLATSSSKDTLIIRSSKWDSLKGLSDFAGVLTRVGFLSAMSAVSAKMVGKAPPTGCWLFDLFLSVGTIVATVIFSITTILLVFSLTLFLVRLPVEWAYGEQAHRKLNEHSTWSISLAAAFALLLGAGIAVLAFQLFLHENGASVLKVETMVGDRLP